MSFGKQVSDLFHLERSFERFNHSAPIGSGEISHPTKEQSEERKNDELRRKRFGGRNTDFGSGVHVNSAVALTRDRARDVVTDSQSAKAFALAFAQCAQCIRGFTALADGEHKCLRSHGRIAMAELAGVFDFGWNARKSLNQIFTDSAGMKCRAAAG